MLEELSAALVEITGDAGRANFDPDDVRGPRARFFLAYAGSNPVGCGAYRPFDDQSAEVKRMFSREPGRGIGAALLDRIEADAKADGYRMLKLSTRLVNAGAIAFYERHGFIRIANFGPYRGRDRSVCYEKPL